MDQSPKAQRPHGPAEKPAVDNPPYHEDQRQVRPQGPAERGPQVPKLDFGHAGNQGGIQSGPSSAPTHAPAPDHAGSPGYVSSDDAKKTGGTAERFSQDRGGNS